MLVVSSGMGSFWSSAEQLPEQSPLYPEAAQEGVGQFVARGGAPIPLVQQQLQSSSSFGSLRGQIERAL